MPVKQSDDGGFGYVEALDLPIETLRKGVRWYRVHRTVHEPLWFGSNPGTSVSGRFNAPKGEYGVCYFGDSLETAFSECLLRNPRHRILAAHDLQERSVSVGRLVKRLRLVALHGVGLGRLHITAETVHGPHETCRQLALALWNHTAMIDGISYRSRFDNDRLCYALFDRAAAAVQLDRTDGLMSDPARLGGILDAYGVGLDP